MSDIAAVVQEREFQMLTVCAVLRLDWKKSLLFALFSNGMAFLSLTKARFTACTRLRSRAFLLATKWGGFSECGTCLYEDFLLLLSPGIR